MSAAPPSYEAQSRRAIRTALGVTAAMMFTQISPYPLSLVAPAITVLLLQDARPMPLGKGLVTLGAALLGVITGFIVSLALLQYPTVMVLTFSVMLFLIYRYVMTTREHFVIVVGLLIGTTLVPVLMRILPELAYLSVLSILFSIVLAFAIAGLAFGLMPAPAQVPPGHGEQVDRGTANAYALTITLVVGSMLAYFLSFGQTDVLVLVYTALFSLSVSSAGSVHMSLEYLKGNVVYAGLATLIVFNLLSVAPFLPLMVFVFFLAIYVFAMNFFSHKPTAGAWSSGTFGFVILLSGLLASDKVVAADKVIDRVSQMAIAAIYMALAFAVLEYIRAWRAARAAGA